MNFIFYTENSHLKEFLANSIPPGFSKEFYESKKPFTQRLSQLTNPAQVIIDYDSFPGNLSQILSKYTLHHFVCLSALTTFENIMSVLKYGSILTQSESLTLLDWWWNRSLIQFQKKALSSIPPQSIFFVPAVTQKKVQLFLQDHLWRAFYQTKPLILEINGGQPNISFVEKAKAFFEPLKEGITTDYPLIIKVSQFSKISPHSFKNFILYYKELEVTFPQLKLVFYFDVNHENFDRAFDQCSIVLLSKIYRLETKKLERSFAGLSEQFPVDSQFDKWIKFFIFEEVKLSWRSTAS